MQIPLDFNYTSDLIRTQIGQIESMPLDTFATQNWVGKEMRAKWIENYRANKELGLSPCKRSMEGVNKVVILIGASPALNLNMDQLKQIDDNFITVCSPTTMRKLLQEGIRVDYVFAVDGGDHWEKDFDDVDTTKLTLIHSPFASNLALRKWKGERHLYIIGGGDDFNEEIRKDYPEVELDICGGNAISTALCWAYKYLWARDFIFCGMSFCYAENYYHDGRAKEEKFEGYNDWYYAMDIRGRLVNTTPSLTMYKTWLEAFTKLAKGNYINCTEDGIFGVLPEPVEHDGLKVRFKPKYIPWISIAPLGVTISAYKMMIQDKKEPET